MQDRALPGAQPKSGAGTPAGAQPKWRPRKRRRLGDGKEEEEEGEGDGDSGNGVPMLEGDEAARADRRPSGHTAGPPGRP